MPANTAPKASVYPHRRADQGPKSPKNSPISAKNIRSCAFGRINRYSKTHRLGPHLGKRGSTDRRGALWGLVLRPTLGITTALNLVRGLSERRTASLGQCAILIACIHRNPDLGTPSDSAKMPALRSNFGRLLFSCRSEIPSCLNPCGGLRAARTEL